MSGGRFITFEGIDGAGKSTHIEAAADWWRGRGASVLCTREPGGTALAERVRELMLTLPMDAVCETLLVFAARRDHLMGVIEPALAAGQVVLCDRFTDATFAYQGGGRGVAAGALEQLESWVQAGRQPDLTLWFDLPAEVAAQRRGAREADRFEREDAAFFERVRGAYRARLVAAPARIRRIDAALAREAVWDQVAATLAELESP